MRVAQNRSAWCELWRPSASSGMNNWDDDDDIKYILNLSDLFISISEIQWHEEKAAKYLRYPMGFDLSHIYVTEKRHAMGRKKLWYYKTGGVSWQQSYSSPTMTLGIVLYTKLERVYEHKRCLLWIVIFWMIPSFKSMQIYTISQAT